MIKLRLFISNESHSEKPQPTLFSFVITCDRRLRKFTQNSTPTYIVAHLVCQFFVREFENPTSLNDSLLSRSIVARAAIWKARKKKAGTEKG